MMNISKIKLLRAPSHFLVAANRAKRAADELDSIVALMRRSTLEENSPDPNINIDAVRMLAHSYSVAAGEIQMANEKYKDRIELKREAKP